MPRGCQSPTVKGWTSGTVAIGTEDHGSVIAINRHQENEPSIQVEGGLGREGLSLACSNLSPARNLIPFSLGSPLRDGTQ